jgi:DNA-binding NarL/FixJ family response regulator
MLHLLRWLVAPDALAAGWGEPVAWLQDAVRWFAAHGYGPLAGSCRVLLRDAGASVPRRGRGTSPVPDTLRERGVTSREMDVLRLVAERLTNRQIADRLVLSPKTVESHISAIFQKLDLAVDGETHRRVLATLRWLQG